MYCMKCNNDLATCACPDIDERLTRYVDEFTWRLNEGDVERHTIECLNNFVDAIVGKRLTYARLIA